MEDMTVLPNGKGQSASKSCSLRDAEYAQEANSHLTKSVVQYVYVQSLRRWNVEVNSCLRLCVFSICLSRCCNASLRWRKVAVDVLRP